MMMSVNHMTIRQATTPDQQLGRVNATFRTENLTAALLGALAGGMLGQTLGLRAALVVAGVALLCAPTFLVGREWRDGGMTG
jgi:predicted MFS family arabinose efflux permease